MIIVNATLKGENTYKITVGESTKYQVSAFDLSSALDLVANHIECHEVTDLYIDAFTLDMMAKCSKYQTADAYAKAHNLVCCGTNGIYLEITSIKGCPNG